jgi:hypothetical protein
MHGLCVNCHRETQRDHPQKPHLAVCTTCHGGVSPDHLQERIKGQFAGPYFNRVALPGASLVEKED